MSNLQGRTGAAVSRSLPPAPQAEVLASLELERGDSLYRRGDADTGVFRVRAGLLKLFLETASGRERITGIMGPGDLLGSLAGPGRLSGESAEALSRSVRVELLDPCLSDSERLAALSSQAEQLRDTLENGELSVPCRLARTFLRLAGRFGHEQKDGSVRLTLPLTHDNLAAMIGAARETTSFTLAELRRAGIVEGTRGSYLLRPAQLQEFAARNSLN